MKVSRRSVLLSGGILGASLMTIPWEAVAAALQHHAPEPPAAGASVLDATDIADLDAITSQIIPTDSTPGAHEAGVVHFIDRALSSFFSPVAAEFRAGLDEFRRGWQQRFPGVRSFAELTSPQQIEWLHSVERSPFFNTVRQLTVLGMFSNPAYGGNRDGAGWRVLGFQDLHEFSPPFGYYDRDYPGFQPVGLHPGDGTTR